ncbi:flavin-containing monooxygenase [Amycolatopsis mediterranei]|uniref:flavin-containing monooxygenase n=1 Tax=Amycolatopsis mediterranei TaxID=33910 RepID=UPI001E35C1CD|nr:NAD(P)/FAD-dependent oxidoreductase [Amycolatopsis mediterranei]UZF76294.1 NAD(P)/FAD-dependent oxidoreductase [Amycolatopsis mediterranei]
MRRDIRFGAKMVSATWYETTGLWTVRTADGTEVRARFPVAATGILSVPHIPDIPGRAGFRGDQHHTGLWPKTPVDFAGKRVALIGTGSSGVQLVPALAGEVASLTVQQRTPDWCIPLNNNGPLSAEEQAQLKADYERIRDTLNPSPSGFPHTINMRKAAEDSAQDRPEFYEKMRKGPDFTKLTENCLDMLTDPAVNAEWCEFTVRKIRAIVADPETAGKLIPNDHYEAYNNPNVSLVSLLDDPNVLITETGIETAAGAQGFDIIIWATGYDFGTGALNRVGVRGREGLALEEHWADRPRTFSRNGDRRLPELLLPRRPHGALGDNPRYPGDQVYFGVDALVHTRDHGYDVVEVTIRPRKRGRP